MVKYSTSLAYFFVPKHCGIDVIIRQFNDFFDMIIPQFMSNSQFVNNIETISSEILLIISGRASVTDNN